MAQNEMGAKRRPPLRVRLSAGLGPAVGTMAQAVAYLVTEVRCAVVRSRGVLNSTPR